MSEILTYIIKSFRGGVSDEDDKGIAGSFKHGHSLDIHKKKDSLSCQQVMKRESSGDVVTDLPRFFVPCSVDGSIYAFGAGGTIYARSNTGVWTSRYHDANGAIKGAYCWTFSDGSTYLVWATNTSVARKQMWTTTSGSNWGNAEIDWYTQLTPSDWHTMENATGNLMICNKLYLAMLTYAIAEPIFTTDAVNIRPGNTTKCLEERDDYAIIGSVRDTKDERGHIWSWISSAYNYVQKKKVPAAGVNALIFTELPFLQAGTKGELFYSDFDTIVPVHAISGGGQCNPGGVCEDENLALFGIYGGTYPGIWSYGRRLKNRPHVLNYEYRLSPTAGGSTVTEIGGIANIDGDIYASWTTTDEAELHYGIDIVDTTSKATAVYEGLEFDGELPHVKKYFQQTKITMEKLPTGCDIVLQYQIDRSGIWKTAKTGEGGLSFSKENTTEAIFTIGEMARIIEIKLLLTPSGNTTPEILSIAVYLGRDRDEY